MGTSADEMAGMYFKRIEGVSLSDQGVDIQMFNIVVALDGNRDLQTIALEEGYDLDDLLRKVSRLHGMGLVESVSQQGADDGRMLLAQLSDHLSVAVGPIAGIIIEDIAADMGYTRHSLPRNKLAELIRRIGERISDKSFADEFLEKAALLIRRAG